MVSTTMTVVDGFPRALSVLVDRFGGAEAPASEGRRADRTRAYWLALAALALGALVILAFFVASMRRLIDLATTLSFLSAPVLSWLNHRAVTGAEVPAADRPGAGLRAASAAAIVAQAALATLFLLGRAGLW